MRKMFTKVALVKRPTFYLVISLFAMKLPYLTNANFIN